MRQLKITKSITNRESPSLEKYLQEIGRVELIKPDEEVILARRIREAHVYCEIVPFNADLARYRDRNVRDSPT